MIRLGVNLDHIATLRQARGETYPDPVRAALLAELGGADNITCHLREDRRHIQDNDIVLLRKTIDLPLNFEMAVTEEMLAIAEKTKPHAVTLVPEKREELTTEGGLDVKRHFTSLSSATDRLKKTGALVSLFVDASEDALRLSHKIGADAVEIHTGHLCKELDLVVKTKDKFEIIKPYIELAELCHQLDMQLHFGHGLNYNNAYWLQLIPYAEEANIGHSIIARSLFVGLQTAVSDMKDLLNNPAHCPRIG
jgi:pyridoxine 5-phosphate synthase